MELAAVSGEEGRARKKRSRFGCNTCRTRKVKCDERPNGCANCERLHLECSGYQPPSRPSATPSINFARKRTYRSCAACRIARSKCSGERPSCQSCRKSGRHCSFQDAREASAVPSESLVAEAGLESPAEVEGTSVGGCASSKSPMLSTRGENGDGQLPWLTSQELPGPKHIRVLLSYYFQNIHPLRCFAFIHKPSFLCDLDNSLASPSLRENALLHIMCTLGAQFYALEHSDTVQALPSTFILQAGSRWARRAQMLLLENMDKISVESLMTAQLLYDYSLRRAQFPKAFLLSALMARMTQALQINLEYSADVLAQSPEHALSVSTRECRRRVMWSCYVTDALLGSGVDQLTLIEERDLKIQLPVKEFDFLHEQARITVRLNGSALPFLPPDSITSDPTASMGILAYFVQHVRTRKRVLKYIKHLESAVLPWLPGSEFQILDRELRQWYESLPANLQFKASTIYMRKESNQLGALCLLHCAFHQTMCDLYRLGTPALYKLRHPFQFPPEQRGFMGRLQWTLFEEARALATVIGQTEQHGPRMLADSWLPTIAYDSNRIMLYFLTQAIDHIDSKEEIIAKTIPLLQSNVRALTTMKATNVVADGLSRAAETMMGKLGVDSNSIRPWPNVILDDPYLLDLGQPGQSGPGSPIQRTPDYVLNPLSIYRMARKDIPERHAPERTASPFITTPAHASATSADDVPSRPSIGAFSASSSGPYSGVGDLDINLDVFFTPDLAWDWQPAETLVGSGLEDDGLPPWVGSSQLAEYSD